MIRTIVTFCFLFILCFAHAQSGKITDTHSGPIAGATITILNTNYSAVADAQGRFRLPTLRPGRYTFVVDRKSVV